MNHSFFEDPKMHRNIPKSLKKSLWKKYFTMECGKALCPLNCGQYITQIDFEAGHIISRKNKGTNKLDNLMPICRLCNGSMGCINLPDYVKNT